MRQGSQIENKNFKLGGNNGPAERESDLGVRRFDNRINETISHKKSEY